MADFNLNPIFSDIGGAVSDLYSAEGAGMSAASYKKAAAFSETNKQLTQYATAVNLAQARREAFLGIGIEKADIANAGFSNSGSALDLLRSARQQAALQQGALQLQGSINVNSYSQQEEAELDQAHSAQVAQQGDQLGGLLNGIGAVAGIIGMFL